MSDFLDAKLKEIRDRVNELRPLVDEFHRLEAADRALSGVAEQADRPSAGRSRRDPAASRPAGRRARPKTRHNRSAQALETVRAHPGITIAELATNTGITRNYLYRVMSGLEEQGLVTKSGRGWHPQDSAAAASADG